MARMLTNKLNLPLAVVQAVTNDPYTRGDSDISVTQLISPPYQRRLRQTVEPVEDVAERLFSLYGQLAHGLLERAGLKVGSNVEMSFSPRFPAGKSADSTICTKTRFSTTTSSPASGA